MECSTGSTVVDMTWSLSSLALMRGYIYAERPPADLRVKKKRTGCILVTGVLRQSKWSV